MPPKKPSLDTLKRLVILARRGERLAYLAAGLTVLMLFFGAGAALAVVSQGAPLAFCLSAFLATGALVVRLTLQILAIRREIGRLDRRPPR